MMLQAEVELLQTVQGLEPKLAYSPSGLQVVVGSHPHQTDLLPKDLVETPVCPH